VSFNFLTRVNQEIKQDDSQVQDRIVHWHISFSWMQGLHNSDFTLEL